MGMVDVIHKPVLAREVLDLLQPRQTGALMIDGTVGEGGHAEMFLRAYPTLKLVGLDADAEIIDVASRRLEDFTDRVQLRNTWFNTFFADYPAELSLAHRILLDLGISSFHYERSGRGFSFNKDETLDMRLNTDLEMSAFGMVNEYPEAELASIFWELGEERYSRRIARAINAVREDGPIRTSTFLADIIRKAVPAEYRHGRIHPATRSFQALRIAVNGELVRLQQALEQSLRCLDVGGRIGVIAFHSLEDRIVKHFFREKSRDCTCPPEWPECRCGGVRMLEVITKRPIRPADDEVETNASARSARLRVAEKVSDGAEG